MAEIIVKNMNDLKITIGKRDGSVLQVLHKNYVDWMHACGGKGRCTTCKFKILGGADKLSEATLAEKRFIELNQLVQFERLACQARVKEGKVEIEVPGEYKLPHQEYSY